MAADEELRSQRLRALDEAIRSRRTTLGISQTSAGELVGYAQEDISRIEKGKHAIGVDRLWLICDALEISPTGLFAVAEEIAEQQRVL